MPTKATRANRAGGAIPRSALVPRAERGLERGQVLELLGELLEALDHSRRLTLGPLDLLMRDLAERHPELVVEANEPFDTSRDAGIRDPAVDVAREIDDLIGLSQHLVHDGLPSPPTARAIPPRRPT